MTTTAFGPNSPLMPTYRTPGVTFVRGSGSLLWDDEGREYLDLLSGLAVTSLGHSHPRVAQAVADQAQKLWHVSNLFGNEHNEPLAVTIDELMGGGGKVFFANSGAESNECAIKLARRFGGRGRHVVVSTYGSFHGRTLATLHATGQPAKHEAFQPLPEGFRHAVWNDIDALAESVDASVAAVLLEVVQGEGGVRPVDRDYLHSVRSLCDERGILMMIDEVQTGLGRCGAWFAHQIHDVSPDVVTMAKALGNGMPIGACWARADVADVFEPGDHATTFGGQPLAAATARAVLQVMQDEDVPRRATGSGSKLTAALQDVPGVTEVRGLGLLLAVEVDPDVGTSADVAARLLDAGVIVNAVTPSAIRLAPSLLITDDEIDRAVEVITGVLSGTSPEAATPDRTEEVR